MKQPINEFKRMQQLAGLMTESQYIEGFVDEDENPKPSYITIGFNNKDKFMNQYKTGNEFTYHSKGLADGNYSKLLNGKLELENGYYYPLFRCITDLPKFMETKESRSPEGFYVIYLSYAKESNVVSILSSNKLIDMTGNNNQDKFKSLADATKWITEFEKLEVGEVDDKGYFKIITIEL